MCPTEKSAPQVAVGIEKMRAECRQELAHDLFWAVYPLSFEKLARAGAALLRGGVAAIAATLSTEEEKPIPAAGPVADLERDGYPVRLVDGTAIIPVRGPIMKRASWLSRLYGAARTQAIEQLVTLAVDDKDVKQVVLSIDSPGGSVSGLSELGDALDVLRQRKKIVSHIDGLGASAAYYIASHTDKVYAERTALIGSIGTIMVMYDWSGMFQDAGIKPVVIATGEFKSTGVMGTEITEEQQKELREIVEFYFAEFAAAVMKGRGLSKKQLNELATGRVWDAPTARKLGLVDGITTLDALLAKGRSRSNKIKAEVQLAGITATVEEVSFSGGEDGRLSG